ncbi:hypothetical protein TeGR_g38, partial [Tetraparma gracilis]
MAKQDANQKLEEELSRPRVRPQMLIAKVAKKKKTEGEDDGEMVDEISPYANKHIIIGSNNQISSTSMPPIPRKPFVNSNLNLNLPTPALVELDRRKQDTWQACHAGKMTFRGREGYADTTTKIDRLEAISAQGPTEGRWGGAATSARMCSFHGRYNPEDATPPVMTSLPPDDADEPGLIWCGLDVFRLKRGDEDTDKLDKFLAEFSASNQDEVMKYINDGAM